MTVTKEELVYLRHLVVDKLIQPREEQLDLRLVLSLVAILGKLEAEIKLQG